jgi:predicted AAA+ superfamily ATPase
MPQEVTRTEYLDELERFKDKKDLVKVITGVRRCGKSTLLHQFMRKLTESGAERILLINFEDLEYSGIRTYEDFNEFLKKNIDPKEHTYVILDEIQRVSGWERSVNGLMTGFDVDIYITGSNAFVLSSELSTFLTGRYVSIRMLPLSFSEYCELHSESKKDRGELFELYLRYGAFPYVDPFAGDRTARALLSDLYASIAYSDIMSRGQIRDRSDLDKVIMFLMFNIGNPMSSNSIAKSLGGIRRETVERYLRLLEESYMFYKADRFDLKSTVLSPFPKYYSVDPGLRNAPLGYRDEDRGRLLENIVFLELLRRGYVVRVGKYGNEEIDFTAMGPNGEMEYFQVTLSMLSEEVRTRELRPLRALNNSFPKTIISMDSRLPSVSQDGIKHIHIIDWLMKKT